MLTFEEKKFKRKEEVKKEEDDNKKTENIKKDSKCQFEIYEIILVCRDCIPLIVCFIGGLFILINFFSAIFITHNASISTQFPTISLVSINYPERILFTVGLDIMATGILWVFIQRFKFLNKIFIPNHIILKNFIIFLINLCFLICAFVFFIFALLIASCSMSDNLDLHHVTSFGAFIMIGVMALFWFLQDLLIFFRNLKIQKIKKSFSDQNQNEKTFQSFLNIIFNINKDNFQVLVKWVKWYWITLRFFFILIIILVLIGLGVSGIVTAATKSDPIAYSVFAGFEYLYYYSCLVFFSSFSLDSRLMRKF